MDSQPIPTVATSPPPAAVGSERNSSKPRGRRLEKRAKPRTERPARATGKHGKPAHVIADEIINSVHPDKLDSVIVLLLQAKERKNLKGKAIDIRRGNQVTLESRITKDASKEKKELSAAKLAKIEKRREIRAEKKKVWLEKKAAQAGAEAQAAPSGDAPVTSGPVTRRASSAAAAAATAAATAPPTALAKPNLDDELIFDDL